MLSFRLNHLLNGLRPRSYHATNILLHAIVTVLFLTWAKCVVPHGPAPIIAAFIFAVHPVHCEAVAGVVGRAEIACTACLLIAMLIHRAHTRARENSPRRAVILLSLTVMFGIMASLFKEQGLVTLVLCAICDLITCSKLGDVIKLSHKLKSMRSSIYTLVTASVVLLALRMSIMGGTFPKFASADNPAAHSKSFLTRTLTFLYLPVFNFMLFICPTTLSFDWSMNSIPLIEHWTDVRNLQTIVFYMALANLVFKEGLALLNNNKLQCRGVTFALLITILTFLPASNLVGYVGFVAAERVIYAPSLGLSLLLGIGIARLGYHYKSQPSQRVILSTSLLLLVLCLSARSWRRNDDWKSEEALYRSGISVNPAKGNSN